jgi:cation-transporting ATPase E
MPARGPGGLTSAEVADRVARGLANGEIEGPGRTVGQIIRANVFTRFNAILGGLLLVIVVVGPFQDALFGVVLILNTSIGILQELRARRTLARLTLVHASHSSAVRDGEVVSVPVSEVVRDDLVELQAGDQVPADGTVATGEFEVDESLLTGEPEAVPKRPGDRVLSGSFVVSGAGRFRVTEVGKAAFAYGITSEARAFSLTSSELRRGTDRILRVVTWAIIPVALILGGSQLKALHPAEALRASVAGVGAMIPEGLVLLTSVAFSVAVIRLGRRRVLAQELTAVEGLARVDVVCLDKTGTLTQGKMVVAAVEPVDAAVPVQAPLAAVAAADPHPNPTLRAVADWSGPPPEGWAPEQRVAFSSARKWSGARFNGHGVWALGAPEMLLSRSDPVRSHAEDLARAGNRVLALVQDPDAVLTEDAPPEGAVAKGLVVLREELRPDAADTIAYFATQGVTVKVLSGDSPVTVAAIAAAAGVPGADRAVDARELPSNAEELADAVESATVFGRVSPRQKQAMVAALQQRGHVVAMTGDGVNDVVALKRADIGVAMGSGSDAARGVAQLVLLDDDFSVFPSLVGEGRRVIANVERVANLFVTKTVYAMLLALAIGVAGVPFPFLPRHLTIVSSLTIGIPAFFLALAPNSRRFRPGFAGRVLAFAIPAGLVAAVATYSAYAIARHEPGVSLQAARTTATGVLFAIGMQVLVILERPLTMPRRGLTAAMVALFLAIMVIPATRTFFDLELPPVVVTLAAIGIAGLGMTALDTGWRVADDVSTWLRARRGGS